MTFKSKRCPVSEGIQNRRVRQAKTDAKPKRASPIALPNLIRGLILFEAFEASLALLWNKRGKENGNDIETRFSYFEKEE